jgi:hypothetical protein
MGPRKSREDAPHHLDLAGIRVGFTARSLGFRLDRAKRFGPTHAALRHLALL